MATRKVDLEKEQKRMHKPAAGYPVNYPPKDSVVEEVDAFRKEMKKPPVERKKKH